MPPTMFQGDRAKRAEALALFHARAEPERMLKVWQSQPKAPRELVEHLALAWAYAETGNEQAREILKGVRQDCPLEVEALSGILAARQNRSDDAVQSFVRLYQGMRTDPMPLLKVVDAAFQTAIYLVEKEPRHARPLYDALSQPLAMLVQEDRRAAALCFLGQRIGNDELVAALDLFEPYPLWEAQMLEVRATAYQKARDSRYARARRELIEFHDLASEPVVLVPEHSLPK